MRKGRPRCNGPEPGMHPIYLNVDMRSGEASLPWIDALQAALPGMQVYGILHNNRYLLVDV